MEPRKKRLWLAVTLILTITFVLVSVKAVAIPAFARKYRTSCATCHEAFPRLNAVGEAFRLNGYKFVDDSAYLKEEPVELGDEAYKKVWPKALWPNEIPWLPPISIRTLYDYTVDLGGEQDASSTFDFPHEAEIFAAGSMGDDMSFFVEIEIEGDEVEAVGWLQFEDLFGAENAFNLKVGTQGMTTFGPFTARDHNRLTKEHYLYGNWRLPYPDGFDSRNRYRLRSDQAGIEVNGFGSRWQYAAGIVEGASDISEKDYYFQFAYKFGGATLDGSEQEGAPLGSAEFWRDDNVTFSLFGYRGTGLVIYDGTDSTDDYWRFGPGVSWKQGDFRLGAAYILGSHDNPYGTLSTATADVDAWFVEGEYFIYPWLIPTIRYEGLTYDLPTLAGLQTERDLAQIIASTKIVIRANVTLTVEARIATENDLLEKAVPSRDVDIDNRLFFRLDFAF